MRHVGRVISMLCVLGTFSTPPAQADGYEQLSVTTEVFYLFIPVFTLRTEYAFRDRWSASVRGGWGRRTDFGQTSDIFELGAQGTYYLTGNASRGVQVGVYARYAGFENDGQLLGVGDGVAFGPFVGYKRVFASRLTLGAQLGAELVASGRSEDPVIPYVSLSVGLSFLSTGRPSTSATSSTENWRSNLLDRHRGWTVAIAGGVGVASVEGCGSCELEPGMTFDVSIGWFLSRRFALAVDSTAMVAVFSLSSGFGSFGFGLTSLAAKVWPHDRLWVLIGVGGGQITSLGFGGTGFALETGGGGTLAVGYEFPYARHASVDVQVRATHGSFHPSDDRFEGVDVFGALVGFHWY